MLALLLLPPLRGGGGGGGEGGTGSDPGPALPSPTSPSSVYPQCRSHLKWLSFLTAPLQQKVPVFPNAPGGHLHQRLLCRVRNMLGQCLGPLLTSRPCDIPSGLEGWVKERALAQASYVSLFPHCPGSWASSALWWPSVRTTWSKPQRVEQG